MEGTKRDVLPPHLATQVKPLPRFFSQLDFAQEAAAKVRARPVGKIYRGSGLDCIRHGCEPHTALSVRMVPDASSRYRAM